MPTPHLSWGTCVTPLSSTALKLLHISVLIIPFTLRLLACASCRNFILLICGSPYTWQRFG